MTVEIKIDERSLADVKARLKVAHEKLRDEGVGMRRVAVFLDQWVQRNFQTEGGNVGRWAPFKYGGRLTTKTKLSGGKRVRNKGATAQSIVGRKHVNSNARLLMDTGTLRHSFLPFVRGGIAGIGSDLPYSKAHEEGLPESGVPQRRMLPKINEVQANVTEIMDQWVRLSIGGAQ